MTITIPIWLVILLAGMFLANSFYRANQLAKGIKAIWPSVKTLLDPEKGFDIKITKTAE